jgi:hypothetical protein
MKKLFLKALSAAFIIVALFSATAGADVQVRINIPLPPPIIFPAPPHVVVIPETDVYVVPDLWDDIFFYGGWWWRPWDGRWYRSRYYDRGWVYYNRVPRFYKRVAPGWRGYYHDRRWRGHEWHYRPIPHHEMERNWRGWKKDRYWEKSNNWGVRDMRRHPSQKPPGYSRPGPDRPKSAPPGRGPGTPTRPGPRDRR